MDAELLDQSSRSSRRLIGIGSVVKSVIAGNSLSKSLTACQVISLWPEIAGEQLAKVCIAESIRDGILYVKAKSSSWSNELTFHKPELLRKIAARLGSEVVTDIHFSTSSKVKTIRAEGTPKVDTVIALSRKKVLDLGPLDPACLIDPKLKMHELIERTGKITKWRRANGWIECARCKALYDPLETRGNKGEICPLCWIMKKK
jgi:hypothetical protein